VLAEQYLEQNHHQNLVELMNGLHTCLKGTRGAVAAFVRLELETGDLKYVGMGNITVRVLGPRASRFVSRDGILGYMISKPREETIRLFVGDVLVMYSDGVREHFESYECASLLTGTAETIAVGLIRRFGKGDDDASCIALRYRE
jgi:serine/threonine protein phosphatase PrpC